MTEELHVTIPQAHDPNHGTRLSKMEAKVDQIHEAVVGTTTEVGMGERIRQLEGFVKTVKIVMMACVVAVVVAAATTNIHIGPVAAPQQKGGAK